MTDLLSIVVPCYNEEEVLPLFYEATENVELPIAREYIFIDDGSSDKTLAIIKDLQATDEQVRYVTFSRNFGKEAAIHAGLKEASGNYVVLLDADLQDPPELLPRMLGILQENDELDSVATKRVTRDGEPLIRSLFAKGFYWLINKISETEIVDGARDYRMMSRQMVDSILSVTEYNRFSKGLFSWVGYKSEYLAFENTERAGGETNWSFWGLFTYAVDGIISYSTVPLLVASVIGLLMFILSIVVAIIFAVRTILFDNPVAGWTSLTVMILGLGGIQLFALGIIGQYLGKTLLEAKNRPLYIVKDKG